MTNTLLQVEITSAVCWGWSVCSGVRFGDLSPGSTSTWDFIMIHYFIYNNEILFNYHLVSYVESEHRYSIVSIVWAKHASLLCVLTTGVQPVGVATWCDNRKCYIKNIFGDFFFFYKKQSMINMGTNGEFWRQPSACWLWFEKTIFWRPSRLYLSTAA